MMVIRKVEGEENMYDIRNFTRKDMDWLNFSCEKKGNMKFQPAHPNFDLYIPEDFAMELQAKNAKVTLVPPLKDGDDARYKINIKINFNFYQAPEVYIRESDNSKDYLDRDTIRILDTKPIISGKTMVNISYYDDNQGSFYANILEVKVRENPYDRELAEQEYPGEEDDAIPFC